MSGFDPLTYAMAREAKLPAGALLPSFSADPAVVGAGWAHLDGSLVSRALYPQADKVLGDVQFFNGTPTTVVTPLELPAGVSFTGSSSKAIAVGKVFIAMSGLYADAGVYAMRVWRSANGGQWGYTDLAVSGQKSTFYPVYLEHFGGERLLLVFYSRNASNSTFHYASVSNDAGQNWSTPVDVSAQADAGLMSVSADAEYVTSGTGNLYFGQNIAGQAAVVALNPATNKAATQYLSQATQCHLIGGRRVGAVSEVYFAENRSGTWGSYKATFNGVNFSGYGAGGPAYNAAVHADGRRYLAKWGERYYVLNQGATAVMEIPPTWTGAMQSVFVPGDNPAQRLLTNTLANAGTGQRFDLPTATISTVPGNNAGPSAIGALYGFARKAWVAAAVTDSAPSADRHFMQVSAQVGSLAVRTTRCADNFLGAYAGTADAARCATYAAGLLNWFDAATGTYKVLQLDTAAKTITVATHALANDYANYLHLPYLPGLVCRMR